MGAVADFCCWLGALWVALKKKGNFCTIEFLEPFRDPFFTNHNEMSNYKLSNEMNNKVSNEVNNKVSNEMNNKVSSKVILFLFFIFINFFSNFILHKQIDLVIFIVWISLIQIIQAFLELSLVFVIFKFSTLSAHASFCNKTALHTQR